MVWNLYENESENKCLECPGIRDRATQEKHISLLFNFSALNKFEYFNSYLSHYRQHSTDIKMENYKIKTSFVSLGYQFHDFYINYLENCL